MPALPAIVSKLFIVIYLLACGCATCVQAYTTTEWETIQNTIQTQFPNNPYSSLSFLEFGLQFFEDKISEHYDLFTREDHLTYGSASPYFIRHLGFRHVSVDMNSRESARKLDCRKDITDSFLPERFDIITNMRFR